MRKILYLCIIGTLMVGCAGKEAQTEKHITHYGSLIKVKKEFEERYIILHRNTFPGVLNRIRKSNIRNYSIFIKEGLLFSHFEYIGINFDEDMSQMGDPVTKDWWKLTDPMQEPLKSRKEGEWWASMDLLYQMESSKAPYKSARRLTIVGNLKDSQNGLFKDILATINSAMVQSVLKFNFQNLTCYTFDSRIYIYLEYVGKDFQADLDQLLNIEKVKSIYKDLIVLMEPMLGEEQIWEEMEEVFHTD